MRGRECGARSELGPRALRCIAQARRSRLAGRPDRNAASEARRRMQDASGLSKSSRALSGAGRAAPARLGGPHDGRLSSVNSARPGSFGSGMCNPAGRRETRKIFPSKHARTPSMCVVCAARESVSPARHCSHRLDRLTADCSPSAATAASPDRQSAEVARWAAVPAAAGAVAERGLKFSLGQIKARVPPARPTASF
jgi:hypothetical protein